ncbi:uncharacterized protein LOC109433657 [Aedes albopictus]|uniref:PHD-type domain-containing protein n=1 Tax=Aedes albopictus TaxID=7160 RepID=A0ABM1Y0K8_AEDAL|nr:uncharacterized protein LOC109433657 [Aedes albopictus]
MVNSSLKEKMIRFQIPNDLKDDLVYCQRSLRHYVKVHQLLASKLANGLTQSQISKLKRYLQELEGEMMDIGNEQRPLVRELDRLVREYIKEMAAKEFVDIDREMANGYVTRALSVHYEMSFNTKYTPKTVSDRLTEAQLVHKYELASFDEPQPKKEKDESQSSSGSSISPTTTHPYNQRQISLLKPKEERVASAGSKNLPPFNSITFSNAKTMVSEQVLKKLAPENIAVPKRLIKVPPKIENLPRPVPKLPEIDCSPVKQEPDEYEPEELPATVAIKKSRMNLLQALNKAKNLTLGGQPEEAAKPVASGFAARQKGMIKTRSDPLPGSSGKRSSSRGASSDSSPNSRSSTPLSVKASDDSSVDRAPMPIEEYCEPQPTDIAELEQPVFLKFFGLLTLEASKALATRKTERKRRSCNSTERKDFHYGKIDYYEQQVSHIARRRNKRPTLYSPPSTRGVKKRKHFDLIASSTGAGTLRAGSATTGSSSSGAGQQRDQSGQQQRVGSGTSTTGEGSKSVLAGLENKICIVCNKSGSPDSLSACVYCCNIYHLRCHSNSIFNPQLLRQRDNICPVCLQKKQQATVALQNQQRDRMLRKRLLRRNAQQRVRNERLQQQMNLLEEEFTVKQAVRRTLLEQERSTRDQIAQLMNYVRTLRHEQ